MYLYIWYRARSRVTAFDQLIKLDRKSAADRLALLVMLRWSRCARNFGPSCRGLSDESPVATPFFFYLLRTTVIGEFWSSRGKNAVHSRWR